MRLTNAIKFSSSASCAASLFLAWGDAPHAATAGMAAAILCAFWAHLRD